MHTAALVTNDGTIDWLCLPAFDSDACFAALLGTADHGRWKIAPSVPMQEVRRRYRGDTLILETDFFTESGAVRIIDFMPPHKGRANLVRTILGLQGRVPLHFELTPRFGFGRAIPRVIVQDDATVMLAGPDALYLRGGLTQDAPPAVADFEVAAGDRVSFVLTHGASYEDAPDGVDPWQAERNTEAFWKKWCAQIKPPAVYRDEVVRSLIILKACTYAPTHGIVAAPTTSLPETPGGVRNWDYRFTWLRDSVLAVGAFVAAGLHEEAEGFFQWVQRAIAGSVDQLQIMYGIRGERRLTEAELDWFPGYGGARPVRVGNAAYEQFQLDVLGEVAEITYMWARHTGKFRSELVQPLLTMARFVAKNWRRPDRGIWEMRGPERSFTASKVSAWTAVDRAIRAVEEAGDKTPVDDLRALRKEIFDEVCREGFNEKLNTFTQYYGGTDLDGSLALIALSGFLPATDPRIVGTVAAIERDLMQDGLVLRFRPHGDVDGLSGDEGVFLACSFWLADVYAMMGREEDAKKLFERVLATKNDLGLLAEEYDTKDECQLGNFPQAFSHFALVRAAYFLQQGKTPVIH
jgi:GH15 family glucan-1,4-alpha-glucosidase